MPDIKKVTASREENTSYMNQVLPVKESFDIIQRDIYIGGLASSFYFIDGFMKDETMLKIMDSFMKITKEDMPKDATEFSRAMIPYVVGLLILFFVPGITLFLPGLLLG